MNKKRLLWTVFKYLLAFALLAFIVWWYWGKPDNPNDRGLGYVWQRHVVRGEPINYTYLGLSFLFFAFAVPVTFVRWWVLVRAQDLPFSLGNAFRLGVLGLFFNSFLPGSVGGDLVKAAGIAREQSRRTVAVATIIMDRLVGLWGLCWIVALIGGGYWLAGGLAGKGEGPSKQIVAAAVVVTAASVVVWMLLGLLSETRAVGLADRLERLPKVGGSVAELWRAVWMYRKRPGGMAAALVLALIGFLGFIPSWYFGALALADPTDPGAVPTLAQHFLFVPIGLVVQAAVPLPGGIGAGEYSFGALFGWFGCPEPNGILGSLVQRIITWVLGLTGYLVVAGMGRAPQTMPAPAPANSEEPSTDAPWSAAPTALTQ